jgi:sec-independent protein translocase protein TatA|tara:strand:+ start:229 stop:450 length:222 start_codon:yes stop_codon:yes gene_type:complete
VCKLPRIGPTELIIILFIILIVFGAGKLPEIGGALGKGIKAFKKGQDEEESSETIVQKEDVTETEKTSDSSSK